ncbi:hypothetical protein B0J17DRAFT_96995 [Rhizoctonia solani]|nr:hypothetical protein B0J17DRAFT_96995 [Rhizoctonia solani]
MTSATVYNMYTRWRDPRVAPVDSPMDAPIIVEAFVPPKRKPSGPRPLTNLAPSRNTSYSSTYRPIIVESPLAQSQEDIGSPPPSAFDPAKLGYQDAIKKGGTPGTSDDSLPLLTPRSPPTPKRRTSVATQLPTVPITHTSVPDIPWTITLGGFMSHFEPVPVWPLIVHTVLCFAAFPAVYWLCFAASGLGLFWARAIVGAVTGIVGFTIGYNLIRLSRRGIDATVWATVIHESMHPNGGVTLEQLNDFAANPGSPWAAIRLLFRRTFRHKGARRTHRKNYDRKPWALTIIVFLLVAILSACLVFVFGRIVDIYTKQERQLNRYVETYVAGDLSTEDIRKATDLYGAAYSSFNFTWSLNPFASVGLLPMGRTFQVPRTEHIPQATHNVTDTIHITETYTEQLLPNGIGFGTFDESSASIVGKLKESRDSGRDAVGGVVRWPKWGIRVGCQVLDRLDRYLTPVSAVNNMTYLYVPKTALYSLFQSMDIAYPLMRPVNLSALIEPGDPMPQGIAEAEIAIASKWWPNGVAHSFLSSPLSNGSLGTGWLHLKLCSPDCTNLMRLIRRLGPMLCRMCCGPVQGSDTMLRFAWKRFGAGLWMLIILGRKPNVAWYKA